MALSFISFIKKASFVSISLSPIEAPIQEKIIKSIKKNQLVIAREITIKIKDDNFIMQILFMCRLKKIIALPLFKIGSPSILFNKKFRPKASHIGIINKLRIVAKIYKEL